MGCPVSLLRLVTTVLRPYGVKLHELPYVILGVRLLILLSCSCCCSAGRAGQRRGGHVRRAVPRPQRRGAGARGRGGHGLAGRGGVGGCRAGVADSNLRLSRRCLLRNAFLDCAIASITHAVWLEACKRHLGCHLPTRSASRQKHTKLSAAPHRAAAPTSPLCWLVIRSPPRRRRASCPPPLPSPPRSRTSCTR